MPLYLHKLAEGGNGIVYSVDRVRSYRSIEIPDADEFSHGPMVLKASLGEEGTSLSEHQMLRRLAHPHVVATAGVFSVKGRQPWGRVIEFLGLLMPRAICCLENACRDGKSPVVCRVLAINLVTDMLRGLSHVHSLDHVMGDVHTGNVLAFGSPTHPTWSLCDTDFTVAVGTRTPGMEFGTPYYSRSPEVLEALMTAEAARTGERLPDGMAPDVEEATRADREHRAVEDPLPFRQYVRLEARTSHDMWGLGTTLYRAATRHNWGGGSPVVAAEEWVGHPLAPEHAALGEATINRQSKLRRLCQTHGDIVGAVVAGTIVRDPEARPTADQLLAIVDRSAAEPAKLVDRSAEL
jgi:serine/threonine protein kinase